MAEKQGFFKRLVSGLTKTRDNIVSGAWTAFSTDFQRLMMTSTMNLRRP